MPRVSQAVREAVRRRAQGRCEYCGLPDSAALSPFHIEHIIPIKHHGSSDTENLAWACLQCNLSKGSNLTGFDLETEKLSPLFNLREQSWADHFEMQDAVIIGKTVSGRVTIDVLQMNVREQVEIREAVIQRGQWASR